MTPGNDTTKLTSLNKTIALAIFKSLLFSDK